MTEVESEIQFRCAPGMRVLRTADIVQIQGGPAVVVRVSASNATVLPMWGVKKEVVDRSDGTKTEFTVPRGPVAVSNSMEPSQILRHMTDEEFREFLDARTAKRAKGSSTNNNEAEKRDEVMAIRKYKKSVTDTAVAPRKRASRKAQGAPPAPEVSDAPKPATPASPAGLVEGRSRGRLGELWGASVVRVVMSAGKAGASFEAVQAALKKHGIEAADATVKVNLRVGKSGLKDGPALTKEQLAEFGV